MAMEINKPKVPCQNTRGRAIKSHLSTDLLVVVTYVAVLLGCRSYKEQFVGHTQKHVHNQAQHLWLLQYEPQEALYTSSVNLSSQP
jgi:hypothetical protein